MEGVEAVIDCASVRPTDTLTTRQVDWDGKVALINAARAAQVGHFIFSPSWALSTNTPMCP